MLLRMLHAAGLTLLVATLAAPLRADARPQRRRAAPAQAKLPPLSPPARRAAVERLGRAFALYRQGDYARTVETLLPLAKVRLRNSDYVLYLLAQSERLIGKRAEATAHFRRLAAMQQRPLPSRFARLAQARLADLLFESGREAEAARLYRQLLTLDAPEIELAVVRFRLGEIARRASDEEAAHALYRSVVVEHPQHPLAERALLRLRQDDPETTITPAERVSRARRLIAARLWAGALDELARVPRDAPATIRDEADYWTGTAHFRMRRGYDVAAEKLLGVAERLHDERRSEALFHGARAWSRVDQDDRAIAGYRDLVARFPRSKQAAEASFLIGWLEYNRGRYREALPALEATLRQYGTSAFADDARWVLGFSRWLLGETRAALEDFRIMAMRGGALDGGKGRYWQGRALARLGQRDQALEIWRRLAADYPFSYYAQLARLRLTEAGAPVGPFGDRETKGAASPIAAADERLAAEPALARSDELLRAGLRVEAGRELERAQPLLLQRHGRRVLPLLFDRYAKAEDFFRLHRLAESYSGDALRRDPHADQAARAWWQLVYPLAYRALVEKYGPRGNNPKYYLYTIMQKESAYNPHDVSYADAIGLLQMIPPTSRRVGERIGRPYSDDVLYDPEGNIQFGAWYIGRLLEKFRGQIAIGAGSYNAGPKAMMRWLRLHGSRPLDEFIELCAYTQTREYMKKTLNIYARYVYLYERQDWLPSLSVDATWVEDDITY